ncbi:MAG: (4Fe-4S)-binding protein, partial [Bacteroidota bacterium]
SFNIPLFGVINKSDINPEMTGEIEKYLERENIPLLEELKFDTLFVESMVDKKNIVEYKEGSSSSRQIKSIWEQLAENLE